MPRRLALALLLAFSIAALALAACGDDNGSSGSPTTATPSATSSVPVETASPLTAVPTSSEVPERGEAPIFWRVCEGFPELAVGAPCKIVFRVTNGYNADVLPVVAAISTTEATVEFEAMRVAPAGGDDKGTFYAVTIELPRQGRYHVTATAGAGAVTLDVDVSGSAEPGSG
ncbi:MAG: hypothetical protein WEB04_03755 [Dehalococcoidia bacterium]